MWRQIEALGLKPVYNRGGPTSRYLRRLLALPFLPATETPGTFNDLANSYALTPALQALMEYIERTWLQNAMWPIETWCLYGREHRTNNDVEGWHRGLNNQPNQLKPPFYVLVPLLLKEAKKIPAQVNIHINEFTRQ